MRRRAKTSSRSRRSSTNAVNCCRWWRRCATRCVNSPHSTSAVRCRWPPNWCNAIRTLRRVSGGPSVPCCSTSTRTQAIRSESCCRRCSVVRVRKRLEANVFRRSLSRRSAIRSSPSTAGAARRRPTFPASPPISRAPTAGRRSGSSCSRVGATPRTRSSSRTGPRKSCGAGEFRSACCARDPTRRRERSRWPSPRRWSTSGHGWGRPSNVTTVMPSATASTRRPSRSWCAATRIRRRWRTNSRVGESRPR